MRDYTLGYLGFTLPFFLDSILYNSIPVQYLVYLIKKDAVIYNIYIS